MLLELSNIQKRFGGVTALADGNLSVDAGEVHLLLGENGAGKSTLMKIVAGMQERDSGRMLFQGREVFLKTPHEAARIGTKPGRASMRPSHALTLAYGSSETSPSGAWAT